jgi:DNA invertase Pin-like site-specific DNA recombinase
MNRRGAIFCRVSTDQQDETTQVHDIEQYCEHHGITIVKRYMLHDASAWKGEHRAALKQVLDDAYRGEFDVLVVWALDRITREGIEALLKLIRQLRERNVTLASVRETWLSGSDAITELLIAMFAWNAQQESRRRSERIRMGIAERKRKIDRGIEVKGRQSVGGRVKGQKDKAPRARPTGPAAGWTEERREQARIANHRRKCPVQDCLETGPHAVETVAEPEE